MIKSVFAALFKDDNTICFNENSFDVTFSYNEMAILTKDFHNINLDDSNYDEDYPQTIIRVRVWLGIVIFENVKHLKKS